MIESGSKLTVVQKSIFKKNESLLIVIYMNGNQERREIFRLNHLRTLKNEFFLL